MEYVCFGAAGLLMGGTIAMWQQRRPVWLRVTFGVLVVIFLYLGMRVSS